MVPVHTPWSGFDVLKCAVNDTLRRRRLVLSRLTSPWAVATYVVVLTLVAYLPSTTGNFFSDDFVYVAGNRTLQSLSLSEIWRVFVERTNAFEFLPLRDLSYRLDLAVFGLQPFGYHLHNIVLYALSGVAVWLCCSSLLALLGGAEGTPPNGSRTEHRWVCTWVTILFVVHPAHVESVGWISGRKDLLSGLFALLSLWQFAKAIRPARPEWRRLFASALLFTLALMSKATVLPVAVVAVLLAAMRARNAQPFTRRAALWAAVPLVMLAVAWFWVALVVGAETQVKADPFITEVARRAAFPTMSLRILGYLARIAVVPLQLRVVYDVNQPGFSSLAAQALGAAVLLGGVIGAIMAWRRGSMVGLGVAAFVLFSLPYLQIVPYSTWSLVSERYLFLPIFGLALAAGVLLRRARVAWLRGAVFIVAAVGVAVTYRQASKWGDLERLTSDTSRLSSGDFYAQQLHIDQVLLPAGRYDDARGKATGVRDALAKEFLLKYIGTREAIDQGDWDSAQREASELAYLVDRSSEPELQLLLGRLADRRGDDVEAARHYYRAEQVGLTHRVLEGARHGLATIRSRYADSLATLRRRAADRPYDVVAQGDLANLEMELFMLNEASDRYRWILQGHPNLAAARYNLGLTYLRQGRHRDAIAEIRRAISGGVATAVVWNNLAIAYKRSGDIDAAERAYRQALRLDPQHCYAAINLGRLYLALRQLDQASAAFRQARQAACGSDIQDLIDLYLEQVDASRRI